MWKILLVAPVALLIAVACGGDDDGGGGSSDRGALEARALATFQTIISEDVDEAALSGFVANDCQETVPMLVLTGAFIAGFAGDDAEVGLDIGDIDFESDTRAIVTSDLTIDGDAGEGDSLEQLWVKEDGEWRLAADCEFYGTAGE